MPRETPSGTTNGVNATFTLAASPSSGTEIVIVDYLWQKPGVNYTLAQNVITFLAGSIPQTGAILDCLYGASTGPIGTSTTPPWETVATLVSDAAIELGLGAVSDVYGSTDANVVQLRTLLKSGCREIGRLRQWTHLVKQYVFTTVASQANYPLPADFRAMIDQTGWDRTGMISTGGPVSPQQWEYMKGINLGFTISVLFRPWQGQLYLYPDINTTGSLSIAFEYLSRYFVQPSGQGSPASETPTANTDSIAFDPYLVVRKLKLDFLKAKGMDFTAAGQDYAVALATVRSDDASAPILSLNGFGGDLHLIDPIYNLPDTGYG